MPSRRLEDSSRLSFSLPAVPTTDIVGLTLAAGTSQNVSVPAGSGYVLMTGTTNYRVTYDGSDPLGGEVSPALRELPSSVTTISVYAEEDGYVSLVFYR